jgi:hypothetical protein
MTYLAPPRAPRITTYPMRGPNGEDRRYIVGAPAEVEPIVADMLAGNAGAKETWRELDRYGTLRVEITIPQEIAK